MNRGPLFRLVAALGLLAGLWPGGHALAQEPVDLELVLLADASRSIDAAEIRFQRQGYADAITHPEVLSAIRSGLLQRIAVAYVEWADAGSQEVIVPWMVIDGPESADAFAEAVFATDRRASGMNAIGSALAAAHALIEGNDFEGTRRVIDFSGDSANSFGGVPVALARAEALAAGITINGLAVYCFSCSGPPVSYDLAEAFGRSIVGGPGSFVIAADDRTGFVEAVRRKFLLEIAGPAAGRAAVIAGTR